MSLCDNPLLPLDPPLLLTADLLLGVLARITGEAAVVLVDVAVEVEVTLVLSASTFIDMPLLLLRLLDSSDCCFTGEPMGLTSGSIIRHIQKIGKRHTRGLSMTKIRASRISFLYTDQI